MFSSTPWSDSGRSRTRPLQSDSVRQRRQRSSTTCTELSAMAARTIALVFVELAAAAPTVPGLCTTRCWLTTGQVLLGGPRWSRWPNREDVRRRVRSDGAKCTLRCPGSPTTSPRRARLHPHRPPSSPTWAGASLLGPKPGAWSRSRGTTPEDCSASSRSRPTSGALRPAAR